MGEDRSRYGLLLSTLGAVLLAVSVYLPWYGVALTPTGVAAAQRASEQVAAQFGNSTLQSYVAPLRAAEGALAGQQLGALSAHDALRNISVLLLVLAGLALLDGLVPLVRGGRVAPGAGGALVLVGVLAAALVVFRIVSPPQPGGEYLSLSVREGAWLALVGAGGVLAGGLWPRSVRRADALQTPADPVWASMSGWTPQS
jgi:hypothetical protein